MATKRREIEEVKRAGFHEITRSRYHKARTSFSIIRAIRARYRYTWKRSHTWDRWEGWRARLFLQKWLRRLKLDLQYVGWAKPTRTWCLGHNWTKTNTRPQAELRASTEKTWQQRKTHRHRRRDPHSQQFQIIKHFIRGNHFFNALQKAYGNAKWGAHSYSPFCVDLKGTLNVEVFWHGKIYFPVWYILWAQNTLQYVPKFLNHCSDNYSLRPNFIQRPTSGPKNDAESCEQLRVGHFGPSGSGSGSGSGFSSCRLVLVQWCKKWNFYSSFWG